MLRRNVNRLEYPGFLIDEIPTPKPDPLASIRYSCIYWVEHLSNCGPAEGAREKNLQDTSVVYDFLQNKYLYWLESLSLLRSIPEGIMAVQKFKAKAISTKSRQLAELLQDAHRFILFHQPSIDIAPLQVYASALIFSPTRSLMRQLFKNEETDWVTLKLSMGSEWNACLQTLEGHAHSVESVKWPAAGIRFSR
ncbi:hypothetical protein BGZ63DRAFT_423199 [Mariannaea sp. PMI_226]|nr:hypothetical protein BGZ63DRAFT_423199 [Mariannaea sp. PMI_226]